MQLLEAGRMALKHIPTDAVFYQLIPLMSFPIFSRAAVLSDHRFKSPSSFTFLSKHLALCRPLTEQCHK